MRTRTVGTLSVQLAYVRGLCELEDDELELDELQLSVELRDYRACARNAWLRAETKAAKKSSKSETVRAGHLFEESTIRALELGGMPVNSRQTSIYHRRPKKLPYRIGVIDGIVNVRGIDYIIETKRINYEAFKTQVLKGGLAAKTSGNRDQWKQVLAYVDFAEKPVIAIIGNDTTDEVHFEEFPYDPERSAAMKRKLTSILEAKRLEDIPDEFVPYGCRCEACEELRW
ncbi:hypothetical protein NKDENANG_00068 [Candidatus Entotheonellaceae bacterium PAL068K]